MAKVKALDDEILGRLTFDPELEWWETRVKLDRRAVELCVSAEPDELPRALARARVIASDLAHHADAGARYAAKQLLALHNREWGKRVTATQFRAALALRTLVVYGDRSAELTFGAGRLFRGHSVGVTLSARGRWTDATI